MEKKWLMSMLKYIYIKNQYKPNYQTVFTARLGKQSEDDLVIVEIEVYNTINFIQILTASVIDNIDIHFRLDRQIQNQETKGLV